jgi:hypothetical protein
MLVLTLAGCGADPLVAAVERSAIATTTTSSTVTMTVPPTLAAIDVVEPDLLLLTSADVPGWALTPAHPVDEGLSRLTLDCAEIDSMRQILSRPAAQVVGSWEHTGFTQRVYEFADVWEASAFVGVVDAVGVFCRRFNDVDGKWTSNQSPDQGRWGTGIVLTSPDGASSLTAWVIGRQVVVLQIDGLASAENLSPLVSATEARLAGERAPATPIDPLPVVPETTAPGAGPSWNWTEHPLGALALDPETIGPGWSHAMAWDIAADPGDPDILLCDEFPQPDAPAELRLLFEHETGRELFQTISSAPVEELQVLIDTDLALDGCNPWPSVSTGIVAVEHDTPPGADSSSIITSNRAPINQGELITTSITARVRYGTTLVTFGWEGESDADPTTPEPSIEPILEWMAAAAP